jgi:hypothetical protein
VPLLRKGAPELSPIGREGKSGGGYWLSPFSLKLVLPCPGKVPIIKNDWIFMRFVIFFNSRKEGRGIT